MISLPKTRFNGKIPLRKPKRKKIPVTVCIAAIYNNNSIIGASDRMITAFGGIMQSQPQMEKNMPVTKFIAVMTAGDTDLQTELYYKVSSLVNIRIQGMKTLLPVYEVARYYSQTYRQIEKELAEKEILFPLGLNYQSFISRQKDMSQSFIEDVASDIKGYQLHSNGESKDVETIIAGVDGSGAHIFVVSNKEIIWCDRVGFAAIGSGKYQADLHLELSGQTPRTSEAQTLINVHKAKKKAEITQGVGDQTDMFVLGHQFGYQPLIPLPNGKNIVEYLDKKYDEYLRQVKKLDGKQVPDIQDYISKLNENTKPEQGTEQEIKTPDSTDPPLTKQSEKGNPKKDDIKKEVSENH